MMCIEYAILLMKVGSSIIFVLPSEPGLPSEYVRAQCLFGVEPNGWKFLFYRRSSSKQKKNKYWMYLSSLRDLVKGINALEEPSSKVYLIKPLSVIEIIALKLFIRSPVYIDVNDPYHLEEFLGPNSLLKFKLIAYLCDGVIFESWENFNYHNKWVQKKSIVVEDTAQFVPSLELAADESKQKTVVWVGSPKTSNVLLDSIDALKVFVSFDYNIELLGASDEVSKTLIANNIDANVQTSYDREFLTKRLSVASISFVPMPDSNLFNLRGNLKAKLAMAFGCIVVAQNNEMHRRLIMPSNTGFLFSTDSDLQAILVEIENRKNREKIRKGAIKYVQDYFTPQKHAQSLVDFFER